MVAQSPPYAEQNAQHTASLFRLATFSAWRDASGIVGPADLAVTAQATPNMSVQVAAGRAWLRGTQVASVSGGTWSTQGAYFGYNDAPVTLTVAAADPTNPRVDAVVAYVTDSFYNGSTNTFVLGVVTGTPAASPTVPATPSNGLLLGTIAVAANATSIASGNLSAGAGLLLTARGGIAPVLSTDNTAGAFVGQYRDHPTNGLQRWNGTAWGNPTPFTNGGTGGVLVGASPPAGTQLIEKVWIGSLTTNVNGDAAVTFPGGAFPNGVVAVFAQTIGAAGNPASTAGAYVWVPETPTLSGVSVRLFPLNSTTGVNGGVMSCQVRAIGW